MSFYSLIRTGDIVGEEFCYHEIPERLDPFDHETFLKSPMDFYVTCSNVETGQPEYLKIDNMVEEVDLLRASASMPYVSRMVSFHGKKLLDGGCTDSIPVRAFQKMGYEKCVAGTYQGWILQKKTGKSQNGKSNVPPLSGVCQSD